MSKLLSFDTSTEWMSIALTLPQGQFLHEAAGGAQASVRLIPEILALLEQAGCSLSELDAIGFGCGPGAFTGLRTACSVAQGLAFGIGKPVIPVDSLLIVAEDARSQLATHTATDVWVAMDARMNEIYAGAYHWQGARWETLVAPGLYAQGTLNELWSREPPSVVAGSALPLWGEQLHCGAAVRVPDTQDRASALARLCTLLWSEGIAVDAAEALPVYLRDKVALTTLEREMVRAAKEGDA